MATIQKGGDKYRAIVRKKGYTQTATFTRKRDAEHWAREVEVAIETKTLEVYDNLTFADLLQRYLREVTPTKKGADSESLRLNRFLRDYPQYANKPIEHFTKRDVALWRDDRLKTVQSASVRREWGALSAVYSHAVKVWGLSLPTNPFTQLKRPKDGKPRDQRISNEDLQTLLQAFDYVGDRPPTMQKHRAAWCFLFAIETGMRASEIINLTPAMVGGKSIALPDSKNNEGRIVPLSKEAQRLLSLVDLPLPITAQQLDAEYRKYRPEALRHIRFHDSRHEALSRMAKIIPNPMTLAKISGHKDLKVLMNVYYNTTEEDLAGLLD